MALISEPEGSLYPSRAVAQGFKSRSPCLTMVIAKFAYVQAWASK